MSINTEIALAILAAFGTLGLLSLMGVYLIVGMAWERSPVRAAPSAVSGWALARRALALRCPQCGRGSIFGSRFRMNRNCPVCGVEFWKSEGEWLGPAVVDYTVATTGALMVWAVLVMLGASPILQGIFSCLGALIFTVALSRWSRSLWTLLLYISGELHQPGANQPESPH
jgi:uncharacterized protein (DUF983 family)